MIKMDLSVSGEDTTEFNNELDAVIARFGGQIIKADALAAAMEAPDEKPAPKKRKPVVKKEAPVEEVEKADEPEVAEEDFKIVSEKRAISADAPVIPVS